MKKQWRSPGGIGGNVVLNGKNDEFYVSYNPSPGCGISMWASDGGSDETALCKDGDFWILNGDFREEYENLIDQGFDACFVFYESKAKEFNSSWTGL